MFTRDLFFITITSTDDQRKEIGFVDLIIKLETWSFIKTDKEHAIMSRYSYREVLFIKCRDASNFALLRQCVNIYFAFCKSLFFNLPSPLFLPKIVLKFHKMAPPNCLWCIHKYHYRRAKWMSEILKLEWFTQSGSINNSQSCIDDAKLSFWRRKNRNLWHILTFCLLVQA